MLNLKGLNHVFSTTILHPTWDRTRPDDPEDDHAGWQFSSPEDKPKTNRHGFGSFSGKDCTPDPIIGAKFLRDVYEASTIPPPASYTRSVPLVWCKRKHCVVSNESSEILQMLNSSFNEFAENPALDLFPADLRAPMDKLNAEIYDNVNNGVYKCGFARKQEAYDAAITAMYTTLDKLEDILASNRYLMGERLTAADVRLFPTIVRFDEVYAVYFKCNKKLIREYPSLHGYLRELYQMPHFKSAINMEQIKAHYYSSHLYMNYWGVIPCGPGMESLEKPHNRHQLPAAMSN